MEITIKRNGKSATVNGKRCSNACQLGDTLRSLGVSDWQYIKDVIGYVRNMPIGQVLTVR